MTWMTWPEWKYISFLLENGLDTHHVLRRSISSELWQHVQRKNLFLTHSRNSRFYRPVSRRKSDWFLDLRIYQCRYDREEDTIFFFWDFYLFEVIFLFICSWCPNILKRKCVANFTINYLWSCQKSEGKEAKEHDFVSIF